MEENKYEAALERAKSAIKECGGNVGRIKMIESIFSDELWESEEEQTRKQLLDFVQRNTLASYSDRDKWVAYLEKLKDIDKRLEVQYKRGYDDGYLEGIGNAKKELEKQGKCEADCPQNHQDVNHPNGCITMEDFNGGEGFYKLNIEYLNKRQVEEIEEIVRTWNKDADCGLCTSKEHCISIEKQATIKDGNSVNPHFVKPITYTETKYPKFKVGDKVRMKEFESFPHICTVEDVDSDVYYCDFTNFDIDDQDGWELVKEPKFKVGDFIVNDYCMGRVVEITNDAYLLDTGQGIPFSCEHNAHLWSISDAKDGDVLYSPCCKLLWIYKDEKTCYVGSNLNYNSGSIVINKSVCVPTDVIPATKEQRELLFRKMEEDGYFWNSVTKELSQISVTKKSDKVWNEEDEVMLNSIIDDFGDGKTSNILQESWLKSIKERVQPQPKQVEWSEEDEEMKDLIDEISCQNDDVDYETHVINKGVEQGRKEMLDEVCEWLKENGTRYWWDEEDDEGLNDLRKAMEE